MLELTLFDKKVGRLKVRHRLWVTVPFVGAIVLARPVYALPPAPSRYAQALIDREVALHPAVAVLAMHVTPPKSAGNIIIAANIPRLIGKPADADDLRVSNSGQTFLAINKAGDHYEVQLPLLDANRRRLGSLGVVFPYRAGDNKAAFEAQATQIRDELSRRISHAGNLMEPEVMDSTIPTATYGQHLVDDLLRQYPNVVILALHASTKDHGGYPIVASNIGRIGKKADDDDMNVITTGRTKLEMNETNDRFEVEQTLVDVSGDTIGAVGTVYAYAPCADKEALRKEAAEIRGKLARRISNPENLLQPYPFDPAFDGNIAARDLLDATLQTHPEIEILAFHATPPHGTHNVIIASNIGRLGKAADDDDMRVVNTGKPNLEVNEKGNRFECELAMNDAAGHQIGAISIVFGYKKGDDQETLHRKANSIRDEVAARVTSLNALFVAPR